MNNGTVKWSADAVLWGAAAAGKKTTSNALVTTLNCEKKLIQLIILIMHKRHI